MKQAPDSRKLISRFVSLFASHNPVSTQHLKEAWENDLGVTIGDEVWEASLKAIHNCSINSRHQLIQFKVIHRLHNSCTKLHSFYPTVSPICSKCTFAEGKCTCVLPQNKHILVRYFQVSFWSAQLCYCTWPIHRHSGHNPSPFNFNHSATKGNTVLCGHCKKEYSNPLEKERGA